MASPESEYPKTAVNKVGRLANRGAYDYATIHNLVDTCPILHVSFVDPEHAFPVVLPMLGCMGDFENPTTNPTTTSQTLYIHGHISTRLFTSAKPSSSSSSSTTTTPSLPITIAASHLDGLVLSLTPFHNSCNYRSALLYGRATLVQTPQEALYALQKITDNMLPGRWSNSRSPPTSAELKATGILRVDIETASAKIRTGGPSEDRRDLTDRELVGRVWTGVVPYWGTWGEPVPGGWNGVKEVEGYVEGWRVGETARARGYAFEAVGMGGKKE